MRIPRTSAILISGVNPFSLAFAVLLSGDGAKVLVVDESNQPSDFKKHLFIDQYCFDLLKNIGYDLKDEDLLLNANEFISQSLNLLARNLCSVIWDVKMMNSGLNEISLHHQNRITLHDTKHIYDKRLIKENEILSFRNIFLLGWRLTGILNQTLHERILSSYSYEFSLLKGQYHTLQKPKTSNGILHRLSQRFVISKKPGYNIIDSKICVHLSQKRELEAGELLPDLEFYNEKLKESGHLHQWCDYNYFSLIIFGYLSQPNLFAIARWIKLNYPVQLFYISWSEKNQRIFKNLNISEGFKKTLLIRPDRYIGLLNDTVDLDIIDNYLKNTLMMRERSTDV